MKLIPIYSGRAGTVISYAKVDDDIFDKIQGFYYTLEHGYPRRHLGNLNYTKLHNDVLGQPIPGCEIHHKDEDRLNAQRDNLQWLSIAGHRQARATGASRFVGVFLNDSTGSWRAKVKKNGIQYHCGSYKTEEAAAKARDKMAFKLFGLSATFNFPDEVFSKTL